MKEKEKINQYNEKLKTLIGKGKRKELSNTLVFGEKYKKEGKILKEKFWSNGSRAKFLSGLKNYEESEKHFIEGLNNNEKEQIDDLDGITKERFINEYLHDIILYKGALDLPKTEEEIKVYNFNDLKEGNIKMKEGVKLEFKNSEIKDKGVEYIVKNIELKEGVILDLYKNGITEDGAKCLANLELKEGVQLNLGGNEIRDLGIQFLADKLKLKKGVYISFRRNKIGNKGLKAIIENMELEEGVQLEFYENEIGDEGAQALIDGLELKNNVVIGLMDNKISEEMKQKLKEWNISYVNKGITCLIVL